MKKTKPEGIYTIPMESATRKEIDRILVNLGWNIDEFNKDCNVFTERVKTKAESKKIKDTFPKGRFPDYVLYSSKTRQPIAIIEAKRIGIKLEKALIQAKEYAECIGAKIIFAVDGSIVEARWLEGNKYLRNDEMLISELLTEKALHKFIDYNTFEIFTPLKATKTREDLIAVFKKTNDLLREEGLREGIERFTEFSNILFLKLIDEIEDDREVNGEERKIEKDYCWKAFNDKPAKEMLDYINLIILPKLAGKYNHSGDVFSTTLKIKNPETIELIVKELSKLTLLDVDSDIKGDAFEYFLKNSVTIGNDLGEYYTPRHIVKLMVSLVNPKFGDKVYDPCCGTGGFLIEAFRHIKRSCNPTKKHLKFLEEDTIYGGELTETAKIAKMNMILVGDGHTHIKQQDSLGNPQKEQFDIILTNFPFSQKTKFAHLYKLSAKSANSIFLKHVIDALSPTGRAAVVVPDSVLFAKDIDSIKVRRELIEKCEVEAVIQLGTSTFAPYTKQPTSILIFNKKKASSRVWFFELNNDGFSETGKRYPIDKNDIPELRMLWNDKGDSKNSFTVQYANINKENYKLFLNYYKTFTPIKNPVELSKLCKGFILGNTPSKSDSSFYGGRHLWVTISDMKGKYVTDTLLKLSDKGAEKIGGNRLIKKGNLIMSFKLTLGKTAFVGEDLYTNEAICMLDLRHEYNTDEVKEYLYHVLPLVNYIPFAQRAAKGYTLNKDLLPTVEIPFPDTKKRKEIINTKMRLAERKGEIKKSYKVTTMNINCL
jgi:type I restriction enzyme M protein